MKALLFLLIIILDILIATNTTNAFIVGVSWFGAGVLTMSLLYYLADGNKYHEK